ncbi:MAG: tail fiber domain-containing protein, partial [Bacteroidetes bacterium]|nr:tail fiber domain-containing protein [Bacteroidota bacterium]
MKKLLLNFLTFVLASAFALISCLSGWQVAEAQNVAITDDENYVADPSAMLDVKSDTKGVLVPRMTTVQRTAVSSPATGLLVFDTDVDCFFFYNSTSWVNLSSGNASNIWGYSTPNVYLQDSNDRLGIGTVSPAGKLGVQADPSISGDMPIFHVVNTTGDTVFAVYNEGVRIYVADDATKAEGNKAGFAVGGFSLSKGSFTNEYLRVTPDSVRIYIEENSGTKASGNNGGFAVGGFSLSKTQITDYFNISGADSATILNPAEARVFWYPLKEAFLAGRVLIESPDSVGTNSFATGFRSKSIGNWSQALGHQAIARGDYSTAIGRNAQVNGLNAYALGDGAKALKQDSYSFGAGAEAQGKGCYAFGAVMRNGDGTPTAFNTKAIGDYSLALGFGAESQGFMSIACGSRAIASGNYSMIFGYECSASSSWSMAMGDNTTASGSFALAMGTFTTAGGNASTAFGRQCNASGTTSVSGGGYCTATGQGSVALGYYARAQGSYYSTAFGGKTTASGKGAFAAGDTTIASGDYSVSLGASNVSSAMSSVTMGSSNTASGFASMALNSHTEASGMMATALGLETDAPSYASLVIGRYNTVAGSTSSWVATDPLFVIGTGTTPGARKNSMTVLKNGEVYLSDVYGDAVGATNLDLYIDNSGKIGYLSSSKRYKKDISDMENVDWLYQLRPVNYFYRNDNAHIQQYGLIAEEVE